MASRETGETSHRRRILATIGLSLLLVVIAVALVVAYDVGNRRSQAVDKVAEADGDAMRDSCLKEAANSLRQAGGDAGSADMQAKIAGYCDCVIADVRAQFTMSQLEALEKDPSRMAADPKMMAIVDRCSAQYKS